MSFSPQEETYHSYPPSGSSSRTSIVNGTQQNRDSQATSIQSHQGSISNFSVHTATAVIHKDLFGFSGQEPLPVVSHSSDSSRGRFHDRKSFHSLEKPTLRFRNQSLSTVCTTREPESDRSSIATSTPNHSSVEDEAYLESCPSPVYASVAEGHAVTRVRALHSFEPTEPDDLTFEKGDIIKVVNRDDKDWWRGYLKGYTGIFPVNYVEPLPEPTLAELAAEAQQESAVFSQAATVDRLLTMLGTLDPAKENIAHNEEIQELDRSCMTLRPKILKLIDEYNQKLADLVSMDESIVKARTIFDRMMVESLVRRSEFYEQQRPAPRSMYPRVNLDQSTAYAAGQLQTQPQPQVQPPSQQAQQAPQLQPQTVYVQPYPVQDNSRSPPNSEAQSQQVEAPPQPEQAQISGQPQTQQQLQAQLQSHPQSQHTQPLVQSQVSIQNKSKAVHTALPAPAPKPSWTRSPAPKLLPSQRDPQQATFSGRNGEEAEQENLRRWLGVHFEVHPLAELYTRRQARPHAYPASIRRVTPRHVIPY